MYDFGFGEGEVTAEPVRYMVLDGFIGYRVVDTSEPKFRVMCRCCDLDTAHRIARLMNHQEGYVYL
jgi:hypothetical protein